jgi:hypothetical protein
MWAFELTMTTSASDTINSVGNNPYFSYELFIQRCRRSRWMNVQYKMFSSLGDLTLYSCITMAKRQKLYNNS